MIRVMTGMVIAMMTMPTAAVAAIVTAMMVALADVGERTNTRLCLRMSLSTVLRDSSASSTSYFEDNDNSSSAEALRQSRPFELNSRIPEKLVRTTAMSGSDLTNKRHSARQISSAAREPTFSHNAREKKLASAHAAQQLKQRKLGARRRGDRRHVKRLREKQRLNVCVKKQQQQQPRRLDHDDQPLASQCHHQQRVRRQRHCLRDRLCVVRVCNCRFHRICFVVVVKQRCSGRGGARRPKPLRWPQPRRQDDGAWLEHGSRHTVNLRSQEVRARRGMCT